MSQHLAELCTLAIDDLYGELSSKVFSALAQHGRLTLRALQSYCDLSSRLIKHGLVVLIQQQLVLHYTDPYGDECYYEGNWRQAYALVRAGKFVQAVADRFGPIAGGITSNLLLLGHAKFSDLAAAYGLDVEHNRPLNAAANHINGDNLSNGVRAHQKHQSDDRPSSLGQLENVLRDLVENGFVRMVREIDFLPAADLQNQVEQTVIAQNPELQGGTNGPKKVQKLKEGMRGEKRKIRDESDRPTDDKGVPIGFKRKAHETNGSSNKRAKVNGGLTNGSNHSYGDHYSHAFSNDIVLSMNHSKLDVALRSSQLVNLAARHLSDATARVYAAALKVLERKVARCYDDLIFRIEENQSEDDAHEWPSLSAADVADELDEDLDLASGLPPAFEKDHNGTVKSDDEDDYDNTNGVHPKTMADRIPLVKQHMQILAADPRKLLRWSGTRGGGEYKVDFIRLTRTLIQTEVEDVISARFTRYPGLGVKIVRILHNKGKLDDKQAATFAMSLQKDVRLTLTAMHEAGFAEVQEVPKDNSRTPNKTIYLWFYDQDRCRQLILNDTYKAMSRLLQRAKVEKEAVKPVLDKAERTDVQGQEDKYLSGMERQILREWREKEEKLLVQLARQDELVALLRDFVGSA